MQPPPGYWRCCASGGLVVLSDDSGQCGYFLDAVGLPEREVGATGEELTHALGLLDTGHFDHDLAHLSASLENLDVGLGYTEAVDTCTDDLVGVGHGCFDFLLQCILYVSIGRGGRDAVQVATESAGELVIAELLLVSAEEGVEEVSTRLLYLFIGSCYCFFHVSLYSLVCTGCASHDISH